MVPPVALALIGAGGVGRAFLDQLQGMRARLLEQGRMDVRVVAVARSRQMVLGTDLSPSDVLMEGAAGHQPADIPALIQHLRDQAQSSAPGALAVLVDATASAALPDAYPVWLEAGIHIVTPNKHAGAGPASRWQAIQDAARRGGALFRGEATVGAGLPVLSTLRALRDTGDEIRSIEGVLSGSLAYLLDALSRGAPFSETLRTARTLGYLEPDPREDLSGRDVVRKMVILAREAGHTLDAQQVLVEGLVPDALRDVSVEAFWREAQALDAGVEAILEPTRRRGPAGSVIRFVGSLDADGTVRVGPRALPPEHPFAQLSGTGNAIGFRTRRYDEAPLMIQGPGAGPDVTASGMFADLLEIAVTARS